MMNNDEKWMVFCVIFGQKMKFYPFQWKDNKKRDDFFEQSNKINETVRCSPF